MGKCSRHTVTNDVQDAQNAVDHLGVSGWEARGADFDTRGWLHDKGGVPNGLGPRLGVHDQVRGTRKQNARSQTAREGVWLVEANLTHRRPDDPVVQCPHLCNKHQGGTCCSR